MRPTETTEEAAARELREETGVDKVYLEQLYTFSEPGRDPRTWVMSCSYMALIDGSRVHIEAGDDAAWAAWFQASFCMVEQAEQKEVWELTLSHEETVLRAVLEKEKGRFFTESKILDSGGLAFDHARILACGYERLRGKLSYTDLALHLMPEYFTLTQLQQEFSFQLTPEKLFGLTIHILMSIPRWRKGSSNREYASEQYKNDNLPVYEFLARQLRDVSEEYGIPIPEKEALALMRYFI